MYSSQNKHLSYYFSKIIHSKKLPLRIYIEISKENPYFRKTPLTTKFRGNNTCHFIVTKERKTLPIKTKYFHKKIKNTQY